MIPNGSASGTRVTSEWSHSLPCFAIPQGLNLQPLQSVLYGLCKEDNLPFMLLLQVLQWTFAAAPGHPALREMCDHIARSVDRKFSGNKNFDTLERTGPGAFTDFILKHAQLHPLSKAGNTSLLSGQSEVLCNSRSHSRLPGR